MHIRKIAAAAGFATGAALACAPLAAADFTIDPTTVVDSEIGSQNHLFELEALIAGDSKDVGLATTPGGYDTIPTTDVPQTAPFSTLDYELYGVSPGDAGVSGDPGPYSEFNGALTQFDNAINVELYSLADGGKLDTTLGDYIYNGTIQTVLSTPGETTTQAFDTLYNHAIGDLSGFFQKDLTGLDITSPASTLDPAASSGFSFDSLLTGEANGLDKIFGLDVSAAGIPSTDITPGTGVLPFDTIPTADTNSMFDTLVFGFNPDNVTGDPGAYDVFNGALGEFANAFNVETYSLLNGGDILPVADLIGTHTDFLTGSVSTALTDFLQLGMSDLAGYFDFSALGSLF